MSDPIVDRIDALVRRRRSFVASSTEAGTTALVETAQPADDDDLPVLTEVVDLAEISGEAPGTPTQPPLQPMLDALAADLSHAIEDRLAVELPEIVDSVLERMQDELRQRIDLAVEAATRDFLARRQQLRLPFPEPDHD